MSVRRDFTPPHILDRLIAQGSQRQRHCAQATLADDRSFRAGGAQRARAQSPALYPPAPDGGLTRYIFDAGNDRRLPGRQVRAEGEPERADVQVNQAYRDLGATYRFFAEVFGRDSIDDQGLPLLGSVHYGRDYQNAFWNGQQMVFGDGDGEIFLPFTRALDVVAHELTHGVTEATAGLIYSGQAGALNESVSDVFGVMTAQYAAGQTAAQADWLIGAELLTDAVNGRALRSMAAPGTAYDDAVLGRDPQPASMADFVDTREDNGGVHINSGIPNHAFYLIATALRGHSWDRAGPIWYATLLDTRLASDAQFAQFAQLTMDNAAQRYDAGVADTVGQGWRDVGVDV